MKVDEASRVYVMYNPQTGLTKIGASSNTESRKSQLEAACGCELEFIYQSKHLVCAGSYETAAHDKLKDKRTIGEWFRLDKPQDAIPVVEEVIKNATEDPMVENYKNGRSITKIAEDYQVTRQAILARLKRYGIYDNSGNIYEKLPSAPPRVIPQGPPKENPKQHVSTVDDKYDDSVYLDGETPKLPLTGLKRQEPNINSNGEWFQVALFKNGEFIYAYTKDLNKARAYVHGVRAGSYISQ